MSSSYTNNKVLIITQLPVYGAGDRTRTGDNLLGRQEL